MMLNREVESIAKRADFLEEERILGRPLTYPEKYIAIQNFNDFVAILREEYEKMVGCRVFIIRDAPDSKSTKKLNRGNHRTSSDKHK